MTFALLQKLEAMFRPLCQDESITHFTRMIDASMKDAFDLICPGFRTACSALKQSDPILVPENAKRHASSALVPFFDILMKHESLASCKYCEK